MIVDDKINRFESNFGRVPTSLSLSADWTTGWGASNIEDNGPSFNRESDFGNGLTGLGGLGFVETFQSGGGAGITDSISNLVGGGISWQWLLAGLGAFFAIKTVVGGANRTIKSVGKRRQKSATRKAKLAKLEAQRASILAE